MLSDSVKKYRKKLGLSQDKLARLADIPYSSLIKIEYGIIPNPNIETLCKLADTFNITLDELVGREKRNKGAKKR